MLRFSRTFIVTGQCGSDDFFAHIDFALRSVRGSIHTAHPKPEKRLSTSGETQVWNKSPKFKKAMKNSRSYAMTFAEDGTFHADDVLPGAMIQKGFLSRK